MGWTWFTTSYGKADEVMKSKQDATGRNIDALKKRVKILEIKVRNQGKDIAFILTRMFKPSKIKTKR